MTELPLTESIHPLSRDLDCLSTLEMLQVINAEDRRVADAVRQALPQITVAIDAIAQRMQSGGRLIYLGTGTSGRLGVLDAAECPPTFSAPPGMVIGVIAGGDIALRHAVEGIEDDAEQGAADLEKLAIKPQDCVVGISASGSTPYVLGGLHYAHRQGVLTVGLACNDPSAICSEADICILVPVGAEVISGSTRLKAGTAQKMVLNMLSTGVMVRLGKTYGNLMVDLKVSNTKLRRRALYLLRQVCPIDDHQAQVLLEDCNWEVKTAIAAFHLGCLPQQAHTALANAQGRLRQVLANHSVLPPKDQH